MCSVRARPRASSRSRPSLLELEEGLLDHRRRSASFGALEVHPRDVVLDVDEHAAHRRRHAGIRRHDDRRDRQLARERRAVQRPGAAERDEREVARVVAAADRDQADRVGHVGVGDGDDRQRPPPPATARAARRSFCDRLLGGGGSSVIAPPTSVVPMRPSTRLASVLVGIVARRCRSRRGRGRRRPTAGRCAAIRPRRSRRSSRRRRRSSAPRWTGSRSGSRTRRATRGRDPQARRDRPARRPSTCRPCRSRSSSRSRTGSRCGGWRWRRRRCRRRRAGRRSARRPSRVMTPPPECSSSTSPLVAALGEPRAEALGVRLDDRRRARRWPPSWRSARARRSPGCTSLEVVTVRVAGSSSSRISRIRSSLAGLAYELAKQTATVLIAALADDPRRARAPAPRRRARGRVPE